MASFFSSVRGFGRNAKGPSSKPETPQQQPQQLAQQAVKPQNSHNAGMSPAMSSPQLDYSGQQPRKRPYFFMEDYSVHIVKGNFMTLTTQPQLVEQGEWIAHQVVEQYRLLDSLIQVIRSLDETIGRPLCNSEGCPTMSAAGHTYTWLDNYQRPIKIPACRYIELVQRWIVGKVNDPNLFPTETTEGSFAFMASENLTDFSVSPDAAEGEWLGKQSGFPESFENDVKSMYRQMARCYSHIYHGHWINFWHLNCWKELNTCFTHFINVGRTYGLIGDKEMEPMQRLIEIWINRGLLPTNSQIQDWQKKKTQEVAAP